MKKSTAIEATVIAVGAALLLVSMAAAAETFRWVDADGKVHYSDRPVQGAEQVQVKTADVGEPGVAITDEAAAAAAVRAEHCAHARKRLEEYEQSDEIFEEDEFGRRRELKGEDRVQLIVRAQADVKSFCAAQPEVAATSSADTATADEGVEADDSATTDTDTEY